MGLGMSSVVIRQIGPEEYFRYAEVTPEFTVTSVLEVEPVAMGIGGLSLRETPVAHPYPKYDHDENPLDWARKYNLAEWGIFLQPDTLIPNVYDPQSLNRFMFERGNPYKYTDPDGNSAVLAIGVAIAGAYLFGNALSYSVQSPTGKIDLGRTDITGISFATGTAVGIAAAAPIGASTLGLAATSFATQRTFAFGIGTITQQLGLKGALGETLSTYSGTGSELAVAYNLVTHGGNAPGLYIPPGKEVGPIIYTANGQRIEVPSNLDIDTRIDIDIELGVLPSYIESLGLDFSSIDVHGLIRGYNEDSQSLSFEEYVRLYAGDYVL